MLFRSLSFAHSSFCLFFSLRIEFLVLYSSRCRFLSILASGRRTHRAERPSLHTELAPIDLPDPLDLHSKLDMSRPDGHGQDFDPSAFEGRSSGEHGVGGQEYGGHMRDFMARDGLREHGARDYGTQEYGSSTFYNSSYSSSPPPPPFTADRRPLTSNAMPGAGFPSFVAPRMLNPAQGIGVGTAGSWNSKPASFSAPPNPARQAGEGSGPANVPSQVQPSAVSPLALNQHHRPSPTRGLPDFYSSPLLASTPPFADRDSRDAFLSQRPPQQSSSPLSVQLPPAQPQSLPSPNAVTPSPRTTLWWGELEPWMDEEYAKQVCNLMG